MIAMHYLFEQVSVNPQLCHADLEKFIEKTNGGNIYWSPKIDGVRTWAFVDKSDVRYFTRGGKELFNFNVFDDSLRDLAGNRTPMTFDCEAASKSKRVREVMTQLRRLKNVDPSQLELHIFDIAMSNKTFVERLKLLNNLFHNKRYKNVFHLEYKPFKYGPNQLAKLKDKMISAGYEGIMLQDGNAYYAFGRRTRSCVKVKKVDTLDLPIVGIIIAPKGHRWEGKLLKFVVEYKGKRLEISGKLSLNDREYYAKHPPINKLAEVQFAEETSSGSLRDPRFVRLREDREEVQS